MEPLAALLAADGAMGVDDFRDLAYDEACEVWVPLQAVPAPFVECMIREAGAPQWVHPRARPDQRGPGPRSRSPARAAQGGPAVAAPGVPPARARVPDCPPCQHKAMEALRLLTIAREAQELPPPSVLAAAVRRLHHLKEAPCVFVKGASGGVPRAG